MLSAEVTVPSMAKLLLQNHGFRRIRSFILSGTVLSNINCYGKKDEAARLPLYKQDFATAILGRGVANVVLLFCLSTLEAFLDEST